MILTVFRPKRVKNGKVRISRSYRGRYRINLGDPLEDVPLNTTDKRIAKERLEAIVKEKQMEEVGLLSPKAIREAAQVPLARHLSDYLADLTAVGRNGQYIYELGNRIRRLMRECEWSQIRDITSDSFQTWRTKQSLAGKTLNEYLTSLTSLLNWMKKNRRIDENPMLYVEKVDTAGVEVRPRRAYKHEQMGRLLEVSGPRKVVYLTAAHTGLRRKELRKMEVEDLFLDAEQPFVKARASTTKNRKVAIIALHADVVTELRKLPLLPGTKVFATLPKMTTFKKDLERAGIPFIDENGRRADFHSLRHTLGTNLALAGTAPRVAMEAMRHSDIRLTTKTYTDAGLLPVSDAVTKLPSFLSAPKNDSLGDSQDSQIDSQSLVREGHVLSIPVLKVGNGGALEVVENEDLNPVLSGPDTTGQENEKWCAIQGSNL